MSCGSVIVSKFIFVRTLMVCLDCSFQGIEISRAFLSFFSVLNFGFQRRFSRFLRIESLEFSFCFHVFARDGVVAV